MDTQLHRVRVYFDIRTDEGYEREIMLIECYDQDEYSKKLDNCKTFLSEKFGVTLEKISTHTAQLVRN